MTSTSSNITQMLHLLGGMYDHTRGLPLHDCPIPLPTSPYQSNWIVPLIYVQGGASCTKPSICHPLTGSNLYPNFRNDLIPRLGAESAVFAPL